jgi:16S rRNA (cytosine967-C5)-methyltransferase
VKGQAAGERTPAARDPRRVAFDALVRIDHEGAYANLLLPQRLGASSLDARDRRFVTDLVYGTTRMRRACDHLVDRFVQREPTPELRTLLRLGAYQLAFTRVPPHAAVSRTVALAPARARGFANAVLRRVASAPAEWPDDATRLSYPDWILERLTAELGRDDALAALEHMNTPPPVSVREDGYVQDVASQLVAAAVRALAGDRVADLCAAPGGKATALASAGADVIALDVRPHRAALVAANAARLGQAVGVIVGDATAPPLRDRAFERVLLDAPCSGLGSLRRRPDARWRITPADVDVLADLQRRMLLAAGPLVRAGGELVYSVCTLTAAESIDLPVPAGFREERITGAPWEPWGSGVRLLPQRADADGMVARRFVRLAQ